MELCVKKHSKKRYIGIYTIFFLIVSLAVFFSFILQRRSLVCTVDGESQYIVYLRYMGQYIRDTVSGFLHGNFHLRQFDFSIGIGDDIGAIVRFHPLDFLAALVPASFAEEIYAVILLLRFYLAGLAFSAYAYASPSFLYVDQEKAGVFPAWQNVLSGSLVYVFGGYMLIRVTNHPTYAAPFIVLPLLLLGMERVVAEKGNLLFILSVFLGFWSNYYFMYICSIALLVYAFLRYPEIVKEHRLRAFPRYAGRLILLYLVGLMMSMATFLPAMLRYRGSYRLSQTSEMQSLWLYADKRRYVAWFLNLISPYQSSGNGLDLNFAVVVLPALAVLFTKRDRRRRTLRVSLLFELAALLVPVFGYIFAGMNNENNRWMFLIALSLGMCCVTVIDDFADLKGASLRHVLLVSFLFLAGTAAERVLKKPNRFNEAGAAELLAFLLLLLVLRRMKASKEAVRTAVLAAVIISTGINGYLTYAPVGGNRAAAFQPSGDTTQKYEQLDRKVAARIPDNRFYRVDAADVRHGLENSAEYFGYNSIGMYNSILNTQLIRTLLDENNAGLDAVTQVHDLDGRPAAGNLAHVKYYIAGEGNEGKVPYGFEKREDLSSLSAGTSVYENRLLLSAGFTSDSFITWTSYQKLSDIEKEWVKLDAVVLPEEASDLADRLRTEGLREGQGTCSFLRLKGLTGAGTSEELTITSEGIRTTVRIRSSRDVYTLGRKDYLINLGYNAEDRARTVTLTFSGHGVRSLEAAELVSVSMDGYENRIRALNEESLQNEQIEDGLLTGTITNKETKLAVFTVAAQRGWTLYVDGKKTEPDTYDGMYLGTLLRPGTHEIRLQYRTPGLQAGAVCALCGLIVCILAALRQRKRNMRKR
jgi:uncharacterized membrane protein YfhO